MELIATSRSGGNGLLALDPAEAKACSAAIRDHKPDWVLNAGAYTAVDCTWMWQWASWLRSWGSWSSQLL